MFAETMCFFVFFISSSSVTLNTSRKKSLLRLTNIVCVKNRKTSGSRAETECLHTIDACLFFNTHFYNLDVCVIHSMVSECWLVQPV